MWITWILFSSLLFAVLLESHEAKEIVDSKQIASPILRDHADDSSGSDEDSSPSSSEEDESHIESASREVTARKRLHRRKLRKKPERKGSGRPEKGSDGRLEINCNCHPQPQSGCPCSRGRKGKHDRVALQRPICKYGEFEESKCIWPSKKFELSALPQSCFPRNLSLDIPLVVKQYYEEKIKSMHVLMSQILENRGITKPCGYCSKKIACRQLVDLNDAKHDGGRRRGGQCNKVEIKFANEECDGGEACKASLVNGACPAPVPQKDFFLYNIFAGSRSRGPIRLHGHYITWNPEEMTFGKKGSKGEKQALRVRDGDSSEENSSEEEADGDKKYTSKIPLWHCVKNSAGDSCLCCCGGYFPDIETGKCVAVKHGNDYPPIEIDALFQIPKSYE